MNKYGGYLGILKWSLAQDDGTSESKAAPMSAADKEWLKQAMESFVVDEVDVMRGYLAVLKEPTVAATDVEAFPALEVGAAESKAEEESGEAKVAAPGATVETKVQALVKMEEICENLDKANDLHVIGGYEVVIGIMADESADPRLRSAAASLMAACIQNNPKTQDAAFESGIVEPLVKGLAEAKDESVRYSFVLCASCAIRGCEKALSSFVRSGGLLQLGALLRSDASSLRLRRKVIFIINSLVNGDSASLVKDAVREMLLIPVVASFVGAEDVSMSENAIECLSELCVKNAANVAELKAVVGMVGKLKVKLAELEALPEAQRVAVDELVVRIKVLLKRLERGITLA